MKVGFKTGPQSWAEGQRLVTERGASFCEVWFAVDQSDTYTDALQWFREHSVDLGLHHWGICGGFKSNLATADTTVRAQTIAQIKRTIDIAADLGCVYVNAHPGAACLEKINFNPLQQQLVSASCISDATATALFVNAATELHNYAHTKKMTLTFETIPGAEKVTEFDREHSYQPQTISPQTLAKFANAGGYLANDITHTAAYLALTHEPLAIWAQLMAFTKAVHQSTKLLHINRVRPPYNGTDSHDGITEADWQQAGIPTRDQLHEFLQVFKNRDDVYIIPEPQNDMTSNFLALQALVRKVEAS